MKYNGLVITTIIALGLLLVSKWMVLVDILLVPVLLQKFNRPVFVCPKCFNIDRDNYVILDENIKSKMTHGRKTKNGKLDRRFNTQYSYNKFITIGIECSKCGTCYKSNRMA